jgi:anti-sigma factor RsiW
MCNQVYKNLLVSYLYDDINDMDRAKVEMHLRACEECRAEMDTLRDVRVDLGTWAPPLPDLGFRIVRDAKHLATGRDATHFANADSVDEDAQPLANEHRAAKPSWRSWLTPAAGLAAAATLVFAAALSLAHVEIHNGPDGFTVRTGWSADTAAGVATAGLSGSLGARMVHDVILPSDEGVDLAGIVRRIDALESALREAPQTRNASTVNARASDEELIKRVREMLARSEMKQQGELVLRIAQVVNAFDTQRKDDLARIQANFTNLQGTVTQEVVAHRELVNYMTTAGKQK